MSNPFHYQEKICRSSKLILQANIFKEIAEAYDRYGEEYVYTALTANIETSNHEIEAWNRSFFLDARNKITNQ